MKLDGIAEFPYDQTTVWHALHDIGILTKTIPGCKSMIPDGDEQGMYRVVLALGVAAIKGEYEGKVSVHDIELPNHYTLKAEGAGTPGYINLTVDCRLGPSNVGSSLRWACDAEVGGLIAGIGGRVLTGISKYLANQFFKAFNAEMKSAFDAAPKPSAYR